MRNGYIGELSLHEENLNKSMNALEAELDADPDTVATDDLETLTSQVGEAVMEFSSSQSNIRKVLATCWALHSGCM